MQVLMEDPGATDQRLRSVCQKSNVERMLGTYVYSQFDGSAFATAVDPEALGLIRDGGRWSQLVRSTEGQGEPLVVFAIHFPTLIDNSGFVGWLASLLKARHGTGVIVICGMNDLRGGIFDYWGVPEAIAAGVSETLNELFRTEKQ